MRTPILSPAIYGALSVDLPPLQKENRPIRRPEKVWRGGWPEVAAEDHARAAGENAGGAEETRANEMTGNPTGWAIRWVIVPVGWNPARTKALHAACLG